VITVKSVAHSLGGAKKLHIEGWGLNENFIIEPVTYSHNHVRIFAPQLRPDELWTFSGVKDGVLTVFSSLAGSKDLVERRPPEGMPLIIRIPARFVKSLAITVG
jgi:hypothetical protein